MRLLIAAACLSLAAPLALGQQMYSWRDAQGKMHYSDTPPPADAAVAKVRTMTAPAPTTNPGAHHDMAEQEMQFKKRRSDAAIAAQKAQAEKTQAENREKNCQQAKDELNNLSSGQRIARTNANGERVYMDDKELADAAASAQRAVDSWCK